MPEARLKRTRDNYSGKNMINERPLRVIIKATSLPKTILDKEPYEQALDLECGHYCYNTYGDKFEKKYEGQKIACKICGTKPDHSEQL